MLQTMADFIKSRHKNLEEKPKSKKFKKEKKSSKKCKSVQVENDSKDNSFEDMRRQSH